MSLIYFLGKGQQKKGFNMKITESLKIITDKLNLLLQDSLENYFIVEENNTSISNNYKMMQIQNEDINEIKSDILSIKEEIKFIKDLLKEQL